MTGATTTDGRRDGTDTGTAALLWTGAVAGVLLRGTTSVFTAFTIGPVLGFLDLLAGDYLTVRTALFLEAVVMVAAVVAAVLLGVGLLSEPARYRRPVRVLVALVIADVMVYLVPLVAVASIDVAVSTPAWALFAVTVLGNLGLIGLCVLVLVRTARPSAGFRIRPGALSGR